MSKEYLEGCGSALLGYRWDDNPYVDSRKYESWKDGYEHGKRKIKELNAND
jgi:hypothetical protein